LKCISLDNFSEISFQGVGYQPFNLLIGCYGRVNGRRRGIGADR
jgi:hypothetical protein